MRVVYKWYPIEICSIDYKNGSLDLIEKRTELPGIFKFVRGSTCGFSYKNEIWFIGHIVSYESPRFYYHIMMIFDKQMNLIKKTLVSLLMTTALVSTAASANADGNAKVRAAGEATIAKVEEAIALTEKHADKAEILKVLGDVRQAQKEFRYEQTERLRQRAGDRFKAAKDEVENGDAKAVETLKATLALYKEMMVVYLAAH